MTRLTDNKKTVEINMIGKNKIDFSNEFFEIGGLPYDSEKDAYIVPDVDYCIEQANDAKNGKGDYAECGADDFSIHVFYC